MEIGGWSRIRTVGARVLFYQLGLNVEDTLTDDSEVVKGVGWAAIHGDMSLDITWEPEFEMHVGPVLVDAIFAELTEMCLDLSMVLQDDVGPKRD